MLNPTKSSPSCPFVVADKITPLIPAARSERKQGTAATTHAPDSILEGFDTVTEFCAFLRISRTTFYKLKDGGMILTLKIGRRTLVPRRERAACIYRLPQPALFSDDDLAG